MDDDDDDEDMDEAWPIQGGKNPMRYSTQHPNTVEILVMSPKYGEKIFLIDDCTQTKSSKWVGFALKKQRPLFSSCLYQHALALRLSLLS